MMTIFDRMQQSRNAALYRMMWQYQHGRFIGGYADESEPTPEPTPTPEPEPTPTPEPDAEASTQEQLVDAIANAEDGDVVALTQDIQLSGNPLVIERGQSVTVDLSGTTLNASNLTNPNTKDTVVAVRRGATLTLDDSSSDNSGEIDGSTEGSIYSAIKLTEKGESNTGDPAKLVINGGTYNGTYYGITGNGTRQNTDVTINGGEFSGKTVNDSFAIYQPQKGDLTINDGHFEGASAVFVKSGNIVINGGTFNAIGAAKAFVHNNNGADPTGDAIIIESCDYPGGYPTVRINGGEFYSANAKPVGVYAQSGHEAAKLTKFIYGGKFNKELDAELIADGYQQVLEDGMYVVKQA